jgi:hypothetical protein
MSRAEVNDTQDPVTVQVPRVFEQLSHLDHEHPIVLT